MDKPIDIIGSTFSADKVFRLTPCTRYVCTIGNSAGGGAAKLQYWDGVTWLNAPESDGSSSQKFQFTSPPTGKVKFDVTAGTVVVSCVPEGPTYIRNS